MSGKSARRQRRKEVRKAEKELLRKEKGKDKTIPGGGFFRNKVLAYTLAGTLALGSLEIAREQLPFFTGKKPKYDLTLVLIEHAGEDNAKILLDKVDKAQNDGRPYKIFFLESANQQSSTYRRDAIAYNKFCSEIRTNYLSLIDKGYTPYNAESIVEKKIFQETNNAEAEKRFFKVLSAGLAIRGIKVLFLESRNATEIAEDTMAMNKYLSIDKEMHKVGSTLSLKELTVFYNQKHAEEIKYTERRNNEINADLENRFEEAASIFPELNFERLKGNQLRAIGFMGFSHGRFLSTHKDISIRMEEYESSSRPISEKIALDMTYPRPYTEREAYLIALEGRYIRPVLENKNLLHAISSEPDGKNIGKRLIGNALGLSQQQIEDLDKKSLNVSDISERWAFILNQVIGSDVFRKEMFR
ncbi:MAG: hypothetical protein ABR981_02860 [Candidatus Micrarchaeaceae archaeon]|jgi:hypothetical protein